MSERIRRTERGTAMVEAAFVLPILMLIVLGMIDLCMWNFQRSQTSSAARDGARFVSVAVEGTDVAGSTANLAVRDVIRTRLDDKAFTFTVRCLPPTGTTYKTCDVNASTVDRDRVEVKVTWTRPAMTFVSRMVGASDSVQSTSIMTISG